MGNTFRQVVKVVGFAMLIASVGLVAVWFEPPTELIQTTTSQELLSKQESNVPHQQAVLGRIQGDPLLPVRRSDCKYAKRSSGEIVGIRCLPSFLIIGAQKTSTMELSDWLAHHPSLLRSKRVEPHFWDCLDGSRALNRTICKRRPWYGMPAKDAIDLYWSQSNLIRITLPSNETQAKDQVNNNPVIVFEKTPSYLDFANPKDIVHYLPNVKIILSIREPTSRMYSAFWHWCHATKHECSISDFRAIVSDIENSMKQQQTDCVGWKVHGTYNPKVRGFDHGRYAVHMRKWLKVFHRQDVLLTSMENFQSEPFRNIDNIQHFLRIPHFNFRTIATKDDVTGVWSITHKQTVHRYESMPNDIRKRLDSMYETCNKELCGLLDRKTIPKWLIC